MILYLNEFFIKVKDCNLIVSSKIKLTGYLFTMLSLSIVGAKEANANQYIEKSALFNGNEVAYSQVGHSDGWDNQKNWIGVNIFKIIITGSAGSHSEATFSSGGSNG